MRYRLDLSQWLRAKFLAVFIFLLLIFMASATEIGISPGEVRMVGETGERVCSKFILVSNNFEGNLIVEDRWAGANGREYSLADYTFDAESMGINSFYEPKIYLNSTSTMDFCASFFYEGVFQGALIFVDERNNIGVGSWLSFNITGDNKRQILITGMVPFELNDFKSGFGAREMVLISSFAVSLALLWFLFFILRQKREKEV